MNVVRLKSFKQLAEIYTSLPANHMPRHCVIPLIGFPSAASLSYEPSDTRDPVKFPHLRFESDVNEDGERCWRLITPVVF